MKRNIDRDFTGTKIIHGDLLRALVKRIHQTEKPLGAI
jgi:hypothetical protein